MSKRSVVCILKSRPQAEVVVNQLTSSGFTANDISVLFPDKATTKDFAHEKNTKAPEGAVVGASAGGAVGGTFGLLAGLGAIAIPGVGPFIAAGPLLALLSGAAVGAAVGGVSGALVGLGIPEIEAKRYEGKVHGGNVLLSIHTEDGKEVDRAKQILKGAGAEDISATAEAGVPSAKKAAVQP
jgi:hypothetical protein